MVTTYERGKAEGKLEGKLEGRLEGKLEGMLEGKLEGMVEAYRKMALLLLGEKYGPLTPAVQQRIATLGAEQLDQLLVNFVKAISLKELHLED